MLALRSQLALLAIGIMLLAPSAAYAALVNINTADAATLDTLPGIGPTKAAAIVDYRTENGPFAATADIQKVSGIGPSTFAQIEPFITVGDAVAAPSAAPALSSSASVAADPPTVAANPSTRSVARGGSANALVEVPAAFTATTHSGSGAEDGNASLAWSFGDGSSGQGSAATKTYHYPGTYLVTVTATDGAATASAELAVTVSEAAVAVAAVTGDGIVLRNATSTELDLSGWRMAAGGGYFRFPSGTRILPNASALFPWTVTSLPVAYDVALEYPDGLVAARYEPQACPVANPTQTGCGTGAQPQAPAGGSVEVQGVLSTVDSVSTAHEHTAVTAPAAPEVPAAAGALSATIAASTVPDAALSADAVSAVSPGVAKSLLHSPWTYGFLGILTVAGGAFLIL